MSWILLLTLFAPQEGDELKPAWVTTEPALPDKAEEGNPDMIPLKGGGYLHFEKLESGERVSRAVIFGKVALQEGLIELFICAEGGKDYESAVVTACDVQQLDLSLVLGGMKKGVLREKLGEPAKGEGSRVLVFAQWKDAEGTVRTCRAEDLVHDVVKKRTMPRVGWTYIGAWEEDVDPVTQQPNGKKFLRAVRSRTLLATFHDPGALLDNPIVTQARDDTTYYANRAALPASGTDLKIFFRLPSADELMEIEALEKKLAEEK